MPSPLTRRLLPRNATHREWLTVLDERLPRLETPTSADAWRRRAARVRADMLDLFVAGHPKGLLEAAPRIEWCGTVDGGPGYRIRKLRYEGYPGLWVPALLYEPTKGRGPIPAVLNPNGHHAGGKAMDYKQARCINLAKRGMLALNTEFIGMGELRADADHLRIGLLDALGTAGIGVFYLLMKRGLDVLLAHPRADRERVCMTGLSGGGWQTAVLSALDERVKVIVPVAGHSAMWQRRGCPEDIGDLEQCPSDMCTVADYDVLTALFAPRPTLLIYNRHDDCCFQTKRTRASIYRPARAVYELLGAGDNLRLHDNVDPGTHNYERDNRRQLYRFLDEQFGLDTPGDDLPFEDELLTEEQLTVGLPSDNATLLSLARERLVALRRHRATAKAPSPAVARRRLRQVLRLPDYGKATGRSRGAVVRRGGRSWESYVLSVGPWSVPLTVITPDGARDTEVGLADAGRAAAPMGGLDAGRRVLAVDLLGTGEARGRTYQQAMLLATAGERALGVRVAQLLAVVDWARRRYRARDVHLAAGGRAQPVVAHIAAALEPARFAGLTTVGSLMTLEHLVEWPIAYADNPELFCFGLLAEFDLPDLLRLSAPVPIVESGRGPLR